MHVKIIHKTKLLFWELEFYYLDFSSRLKFISFASKDYMLLDCFETDFTWDSFFKLLTYI